MKDIVIIKPADTGKYPCPSTTVKKEIKAKYSLGIKYHIFSQLLGLLHKQIWIFKLIMSAVKLLAILGFKL